MNMHSLAASKIAHIPLKTLILEKTVLYFEGGKQQYDASFRENEKLLETARIKTLSHQLLKIIYHLNF